MKIKTYFNSECFTPFVLIPHPKYFSILLPTFALGGHMKLSSREQIASLAKFKSDRYLTTSFYLNTDKSHLTKKQITLSIKNLLNDHKTSIEKSNLGKRKTESLKQDLDKINRFCEENLNSHTPSGLAIFSCGKEKFWEVFELPSPPRNRILMDQDPYVRPLSAILNEHRRICVLLFDKKEAMWYDLFLGKISLTHRIESDVPSKVREGGWEGYESKRIERHIATHLHDYFKEIAKKTFELFKAKDFEWLFLGCNDEYGQEFEPLLHPYLQKSLKTRLKSKPGDPSNKILKEASILEKTLKDQEEKQILDHYISMLKKGGLAISGLTETLRSLNRGEVQTLLIIRHLSKSGKSCPKCGFLFVDEIKCPSCLRKTEPVLDVIDEAVEAALGKKAQVIHLDPPSKLSRYGDIGALLRYKT
jgi:peptide subunit release factor 1 (eRF1)